MAVTQLVRRIAHAADKGRIKGDRIEMPHGFDAAFDAKFGADLDRKSDV